jgi:hypothetical protein
MRQRRNLLLLPVACLAIVVLAAQTPGDPDWQTAAGGKMAFEVASVKPSKVPKMPSFPLNTGGREATGRSFLRKLSVVGLHFIRI